MANPYVQVAQDVMATNCAELAATVIVVFDHLITLDEEIDLIWTSHWTAGKILFFINRYYTLGAVLANTYGLFSEDINDAVSRRFFQWQGWTGLVGCMIAESILQMRIYALYFLDKKVLILMISTFILSTASAGTIMGLALSKMQIQSHILPGIKFCTALPDTIPSYFYAFWIPLLAFETVLCTLALYRAISSGGAVFESGRRLVHVMVRDSVFYFLVMFATYLTNLLVWTIGRVTLLEIPIGFSLALSCALTNRLILNVRRTSMKEGREPLGSNILSSTGEGRVLTRITAQSHEMIELRSMKSDPHHDEEGFIVL